MLEQILTSGILIAGILLIRLLLGSRIQQRIKYALWLLVLCKLLLPFISVENPYSILRLADGMKDHLLMEAQMPTAGPAYSEMGGGQAEKPGIQTTKEGDTQVAKAEEPQIVKKTEKPQFSTLATAVAKVVLAPSHGIRSMLYLVWAVGIGILGFLLLAANIRFYLRLKSCRKEILAGSYPVKIYEAKAVSGPCLFGVFQPAVYLPMGLAVSGVCIEHIIVHEYMHYRHRDFLWAMLRCICVTVYWFHPLVWVAAFASMKDGELACDEAAVCYLGERQRQAYGATLLHMAACRSQDQPFLSCAAHAKGQGNEMKRRITIIVKRPKATLVTMLALLLAVFLLADAAFSSTEAKETVKETVKEEAKETGNYKQDGEDDTPGDTDMLQNTDGDAGMPQNGNEDTNTSPNADGNTTTSPNADGNTSTHQDTDTTAPEEEPITYFERDGKWYEMVEDLVTGEYLWASVLTDGKQTKDSHGHEKTDYDSQERSFERVDTQESVPVRRWDNLLYSAGEYLIFEYDGMIHVSKNTDLYHPVLSYQHGLTYGIVTKVPQGYMVADGASYEIRFYDEKFSQTKLVKGYRAMESGNYYMDGLMAVRDMETGLKGFMDQNGELVIPCIYGYASDFSNGCASVLTKAEMVPFTEDGGTVQMFYAKGGQWGIIDQKGNFILKPSKQYANKSPEDTDVQYYDGIRRFGPVREDGTVDFIASDQDGKILETVRLW